MQRRGDRGVINIKTAGRNGPAVAVRAIEEGDELMVISSDGNIIRLHSDDVSTLGRNTQGVRIMKLREGDRVSTVARLAEKDDETE